MILDAYTLRNMVFQIQFPSAFHLWDCSGTLAHRLAKSWPGLEVIRGEPNLTVLRAPGVQIRTEINQAILTLTAPKGFDAIGEMVSWAVEGWRDELAIQEFNRVSMRVQYTKKYPSLRDANAAIFALNLVRWPDDRVFDQSQDGFGNGVEAALRFEDETAFTVLRIKSEGVKYEVELDAEFVDNDEVKVAKEQNRVLIDFDRGLKGTMDANKLRAQDWVKG